MGVSGRTVQIGLSVFLTAVIALLLPGCNSRSQSLQPFISSCKSDDEISAKDLAVVDKVAIEFVQNALGPNPETAYSTFTA